eukprot:gene27310-35890_t
MILKSSAGGSGSDNRSTNLVRVQKKELEELVSGCWETVAGEGLPQHLFENGQFNPHRNFTERSLSLHQGLHTTRVLGSSSSFINSTKFKDSACDDLESSYIPTSGQKPVPTMGGGQGSSGQGILSSLISQIIAGEKPSEVCVEGMPVNTIRKLVCRQMSMATQLLIQILLQADERSDCFTKGYTSVMELSNMREKALKKAALVQMSVNNATAIKQFSEDSEFSRSVLSDKTIRCHSVFDIPALFQISNLFNLIDQSRKSIKIATTASTTTTTNTAVVTYSTVDDRENSKYRILDECQTQTGIIMNELNMRLWGCLIPQRLYPISDSNILSVDPTSLSGRSVFTPAEDDLLLRGIITLGEHEWKGIKTQFLPSKEEESLQFRLRQMTALSAPESNIFKTYQRMDAEYRNRDLKWSHEEDCALLRGFQTFGDKWTLVGVFFLPHRKKKELKYRWNALQKIWTKSVPSLPTTQSMFSPEQMEFLHALNNKYLPPLDMTADDYNDNDIDNNFFSDMLSEDSPIQSTPNPHPYIPEMNHTDDSGMIFNDHPLQPPQMGHPDTQRVKKKSVQSR